MSTKKSKRSSNKTAGWSTSSLKNSGVVAWLIGAAIASGCVEQPPPEGEPESGETSGLTSDSGDESGESGESGAPDPGESDTDTDTDTGESESDTGESGTDTDEPELCVPLFEDPKLEAKVRSALALADDAPLDGAAMASLTTLELHLAQITSLAGLECASALTELFASYNQISDLSPIADLPALEVLVAANNEITKFPPMASTSLLTRVVLQGNPVTDIAALAGAERLEQLRIGGSQVSDIAPLTGLPKLADLDIEGDPILDLTPVVSLPSLTRLWMSNTGQADLSILSGMPLELLSAANNGIVDVTPVTTFTPPEMKGIDLGDNAIVDLSPFANTVWVGAKCGVELRLEGNPVAASPTLAQDYPYICELGLYVVWNAAQGLFCGAEPCP